MCITYYITYTCGCKGDLEFVQCENRRGTNVKCDPMEKNLGKEASNYCPRHLFAAKVEGNAASGDGKAV